MVDITNKTKLWIYWKKEIYEKEN